jgi:hypothetical protein
VAAARALPLFLFETKLLATIAAPNYCWLTDKIDSGALGATIMAQNIPVKADTLIYKARQITNNKINGGNPLCPSLFSLLRSYGKDLLGYGKLMNKRPLLFLQPPGNH